MKTHLRIEHADEDNYLIELLSSAVDFVEGLCGRSFAKQRRETVVDGDLPLEFFLPQPPLISIASFNAYSPTDVQTAVSSSIYVVDEEAGRLFLAANQSWPSDVRDQRSFVIQYDSGYGETSEYIPGTLKRAVLVVAANLYENREQFMTDEESVMRIIGQHMRNVL